MRGLAPLYESARREAGSHGAPGKWPHEQTVPSIASEGPRVYLETLQEDLGIEQL